MPPGEEQKVIRFLMRIVRTLSVGLLWMLLQVVGGIMTGYAFIEDRFTWKNGVYYVAFLLSLGALIYYYYKLWRNMDSEHFQDPPEP